MRTVSPASRSRRDSAGDPVVLHDQLADRWILTQFTALGPNYWDCIAVSQTSDPLGAHETARITYTATGTPHAPTGCAFNGARCHIR